MDGEQEHDPATEEAGWEMRRDDTNGQIYYWNSVTGETSWKPPPHFSTDNVMHPWTQVFDDNGHVYYLNTETMETQWTPPSAAVENEEDTSLSSDTSVLAVTGGRGRRPSTAEQMTELNRLLSGEDEDKEGEKSPGDQTIAHYEETSETSTPEVGSKTALDTEACPWMMFINEDDGVPYYYNHITGECLWEPPQEFRRLQQEQQQLGQIDETTVAAIEKEELELLAQDESADSTLDNELTEKAATQVLVTPEFEEKVSGGVTSRPRASGAVPSLRFDTILSSAESSALEEEVPLNVVATEYQEKFVDAIVVDELSEQVDDGRFPLTIHVKSAEESQVVDSAGVVGEEKIIIDVAATIGIEEENTVENERVFLASAQALLNNNLEEARDAGLESVDANEEVDVETGIALESEATTAVANELSDSAALGQRTYIAALTLQCMVRGFVARQRVKQKCEERQKENTVAAENLPESAVISTTPAVPPAMIQAVENEESLNNLPGRPALQTQQKESSLSNNAPGPPSEDVFSTNDSFPVPSSIFDQQSPAISETSRFDPPVEGLPTAPSAAPSVPSSTPKQHSCSASVAARLPAVLDVTRYFPQRPSLNFSQSGSTTNTNEQVAITRKKVDLGLPPRACRASQQEAKDDEKLLQTRRKEEEAAQRAKTVEYQRIYRESRRAFEAEKQRLQEEKQVRDNQRQHEAEAEKRSRVQTQHEQDAARTRSMTAVDSADRLVWEYLQTQGRPNEQNIRQFRDALTETLDSTQFPDKMRAERARELQERIKRLRRASWAVDSQLEAVELRLLSELYPLTDRQRPLQAKYAAKLRCRLEQMLTAVSSWQRVLDEWEDHGSTSKYWGSIQARYAPSSAISSSDESRRQYFLTSWRGAPGGDSLLHLAAWNGWDKHVQLLIDEGADVNLIDSSASHRTPLHEGCRAGHVSVVEMLLRAGARWNAVDVSGDSALHDACRQGWTRVVRILLMAANDLGEERNVSAVDKHTPLTLEDFFNLRNGKGRRAIDVSTLPSLMEELQYYDYQLNGIPR